MAIGTKSTFKAVVTVIVLGALGLLGYEVHHWMTHVYASGAQVQTELTRIASRVEGTLAESLVREGERVKAGQLLLSLVDDDVRLRVQTLETELKVERANRQRLSAERQAFEIELGSRIATQRETMRAIEVEQRSIMERLALAEKDLARVRTLYRKELTAERELAREQDKVLVLRGELEQARAKLGVARKSLDQIAATRQQLDVYDQRIRLSEINEVKTQTRVDAEQVALQFRHIRSPIDGIVDRVYKYKGEYVDEGETILMLHDERVYWLEAHVDEDEIRHVAVGQTAVLDFESHPFTDYIGTVTRIGSATTQAMGIADQSASQFGTRLQRVPVLIRVDNPPPNTAPGMRADVNIEIGRRHLR